MPPLAAPVALEVAVDDVAGAMAAARAGAHRIELCAALRAGGLTPSPLAIAEARARVALPLFAMVRPRAGGFVYDRCEVDRMLRDVALARALGADGIVTGALTGAGRIDRDTVRALVAAAAPLPVTFHRAFDALRDPAAALEELIALGCARVLTSGGRPTAAEGTGTLHALVARAGQRITVVAAGTIRAATLDAVLATGVREVHAGPRLHPGPGTDEDQVLALVVCLLGRQPDAPCAPVEP